jgi:uncharacterized RDD family membrane protein YckC
VTELSHREAVLPEPTRQDEEPAQGLQDRAHAFDPELHPERFRGLLRRRMIAFVIDASIIIAATLFLWFVLLILGILTFGLAWMLMGLVFPAVGLGYAALTLSQPESATIGMRVVEIEMRTWTGGKMYALLGAFHALLFWFSVSLLTPLVLLVPLFDARKRCLHDMLSGVVIVNNDYRIQHV